MSRAWDAAVDLEFARTVFDIVNDPENQEDNHATHRDIALSVIEAVLETYGEERP